MSLPSGAATSRCASADASRAAAWISRRTRSSVDFICASAAASAFSSASWRAFSVSSRSRDSSSNWTRRSAASSARLASSAAFSRALQAPRRPRLRLLAGAGLGFARETLDDGSELSLDLLDPGLRLDALLDRPRPAAPRSALTDSSALRPAPWPGPRRRGDLGLCLRGFDLALCFGDAPRAARASAACHLRLGHRERLDLGRPRGRLERKRAGPRLGLLLELPRLLRSLASSALAKLLPGAGDLLLGLFARLALDLATCSATAASITWPPLGLELCDAGTKRRAVGLEVGDPHIALSALRSAIRLAAAGLAASVLGRRERVRRSRASCSKLVGPSALARSARRGGCGRPRPARRRCRRAPDRRQRSGPRRAGGPPAAAVWAPSREPTARSLGLPERYGLF